MSVWTTEICSRRTITILSIVAFVIIWCSSGSKKSVEIPRCYKCGAKVGFMYVSDGDRHLCEQCTKEREALNEAAERLRYLNSKK